MKKIIGKYVQYNQWANAEMVKWLRSLHEEIVYRETTASFSSIDLTIQHIKNAQNFWYAVITGDDYTAVDQTISVRSFERVLQDLAESTEKMTSRYLSYTEDELINFVASPVMKKCRYDFILQVVNHTTYHRGQVVGIARMLGVDTSIPSTDYEVFLWSHPQI